MSKLKDTTTKQTLLIFWQLVWRYPRYVIGTLLAVPLAVLTEQFLPPIILADVLNRLAHGNYQGHQVWANFGSSLVLYAVFLLVSSIAWRVSDAFNWRLEGRVERTIAQKVYAHLLSQSANFHANTFGGSLVSQTNKLMGAYIRFADTTVYQVLPLVSGLLFTVIILAKRAPLFVMVLLALAAFFMLSGPYVTRHVRKLAAKQAAAESKQTGYLADSVTNVLAIKSFANSRFEHGRFAAITDNTFGILLSVMRASQRQMIFFSTLSRVISVLALLMAIVSVMIFNANIATVFLIFTYTNSLINQLWMFCNSALRNYNRAFGDAADMTKILQIIPEVQDPAQPEAVRIKHGQISWRDVDFTHEGASDALFHKLNLEIAAGEKVGLVGHSGSGKTTFTRLLLRFSDIDGGEILIDGQNIAHITQDDLRRHIAYVPQEPIMFHRSLRDNIRYGRLDAKETAILKASKAAHAHDFVQELPEGYSTLVGERGVKLSGGQRQRIAIARAMLRDAPILLLDEATSALDSESEVLIQDALWKLMEGRTAVVIAHRLSTIQRMDRIIVMDDGQIVEQGTHSELLAKNGTYAKLWAHQSGGFMNE